MAKKADGSINLGEGVVEFGPETAALAQAYEGLREAMRALRESVVRLDRDLHAVVYELEEAENGRVGVKALTGRDAREAAGEALSDVRIGDDILRVRRLPGLVAASPATLTAIEALNQAKQVFEDCAKALPRDASGEQRRAQLQKAVPRVHLVQAARRVVMLLRAPEWASFIWMTGGTSNRVLDREGALKLLDRHARYCPRDENPAGCQQMVARAREILLREDPGQRFIQARPVAPHVRVNLRLGGGRAQRHAYLPVFYPAATDTALKIYPPGPLAAPAERARARARARRSDYGREDEPIVKGLHLYRAR